MGSTTHQYNAMYELKKMNKLHNDWGDDYDKVRLSKSFYGGRKDEMQHPFDHRDTSGPKFQMNESDLANRVPYHQDQYGTNYKSTNIHDAQGRAVDENTQHKRM